MMAFVGLLPARPAGTRRLSARFLRQTTDGGGDLHVFYEITNGTGRPARVELSHPFQALHERTGWWDTVWPTAWQAEKTAGIARHAGLVELNPHSTATLEIRIEGTFREGTAMKGKLSALKIESDTAWRLRDIARRLGVPPRWQMLPEPRLIELPEVAFQRGSTRGLAPAPAAAPAPAPNPTAAVSGAALALPATSRATEEIVPLGSIEFRNASLRTVLDVYAVLADAQLEVEPRVRASQATFSLTNTQALSRAEAVRLFEQVLEQQGRIAVSRVDQHQIRVMPSERHPGEHDRQ